MEKRAKTKFKKISKSIALALACFALITLLLVQSFAADNTILQLNQSRGANEPQSQEAAPKVFLNFLDPDLEFFRSAISFVNFVLQEEEAEVIVTMEPESSGDLETLILKFLGRGRFESDRNTLTCSVPLAASKQEKNNVIAETLKLGLVRYAAKTPVGRFLNVRFEQQVKPTSVVDRWNFWVFNASASSFLSGQERYNSAMHHGSFSANRVTPELKIRMSVSGYIQRQEFKFQDASFVARSHGYGYSGFMAMSLSEHWSVGPFITLSSSTYQNLKISATIAPAVEFNFFPYSESTRRQLRLLYKFGFSGVRYREETIYFKISQRLLSQSLSATYEIKRDWGTISANLEGAQYLHDLKKYRLSFDVEISLRVWKGLSFELDGGASRLRDQIFLPRQGASYEEVLLRQKQLATTYRYYFSVGFNFSFGSLKSNIVNPRFGGGGRSFSFSF